jgi:heavy metal sensor kinase
VSPWPLRTSLTVLYTGILLLLLSGSAVALHRLLVGQLDAETTAMLEDVERGLHGYLQFTGGQPRLDYNRADPEAVTFIEDATRYYQVYAADGRLLLQSPALEALGLHYTPEEVSAIRQDPQVYDVETDRGRLRILSAIVEPAAGETYLLQVGEPLDRVDRAVRRFDQILMWQLGAGLLVAGFAGYWMAGRALRPITALAAAARRISLARLHERLPIRGSQDELDELATAFNDGLARVEDGVGQMRQFSAALAHELRTPLAVLRGETELALSQEALPEAVRQKLEVQLEEFDRLARLINQILTLARAESGEIPLAHDLVALAPLLTAVGEQMEAVAEARGVHLSITSQTPAVVVGDAAWLQRLLIILLDNAIKFTSDGGRVSASVTVSHDTAVVEISDTGIGMAASELPHVFERFYQADAARSHRGEGVGLGLALAKWIVEHHRGTISVNSRVNEGSTFAIRIPVAPATTSRVDR